MKKRIARKIAKRLNVYLAYRLSPREDYPFVYIPRFNYSDFQVRKAHIYLDRMHRKYYNKHTNWNYKDGNNS